MENIEKNTMEENRRIVQQGLDQRAEARAHEEMEAKLDAYERNMIDICNENAARQKSMEYQALHAVMEDPKATAARKKAAAWQRAKDSYFILTSYATFVLILRFAEDFGAPAGAMVHLCAIAAVMAIAGIIALNRQAFRSWRKRRAAR